MTQQLRMQELQLQKMFNKGTKMFPERTQAQQLDLKVSNASRKRKPYQRINDFIKGDLSSRQRSDSPAPSQKKQVTLKIEGPDGFSEIKEPRTPSKPNSSASKTRRVDSMNKQKRQNPEEAETPYKQVAKTAVFNRRSQSVQFPKIV